MGMNKLVGIWKRESNAGKQPAEDGIKTAVIEFKVDGTFIDATEALSPVPGLMPERIYRLRGAWKLDENILERTFAEGTSPAMTHKSMVAINDDTLEIAASQYGKKMEREYIGVFIYKRVDAS